MMVKRSNLIFTGWQGIVLAIAIIATGLLEPAYCEPYGIALLLQQTPPQGGTVTPEVGVHNFDVYTEVTLTAVPKPGYQFVYWMGEVSDPTANSTIVYLDAPKIVIAVFERNEYDFLAPAGRVSTRPGAGLRRSRGDYSRRGGGGGGGRRPKKRGWPSPPEPPEEPDFPSPEDGDDFPVPVPEPATAVLLALGSLSVFVRGRTKRKSQ